MCPNCKLLTLGEYNWSILFLIAMAIVVIGGLTYIIRKQIK
jgi:ABC-type multidrug transport system permease subunit